ncbi:hypothetical protein [Rummeliibacillus stabekisii]|uniref:hypothetical protein n=1 Tax=Rummeliibacillus stabekisii TaxID=241244 RepID=UPI0037166645
MTSILMIGCIGVLLIIYFRKIFIEHLGKKNNLVHKLKNANWFQNHWLSGLFLFCMNAILFFSTGLILYLLIFFPIPYLHILLMFAAVLTSILLWIAINKAWQGSKRNRIKMSVVGSSFYFFLLILFIYWFVTIKPSYQGEDIFMKGFGLLFGMVVSFVACITCFVFTASNQNIKKKA